MTIVRLNVGRGLQHLSAKQLVTAMVVDGGWELQSWHKSKRVMQCPETAVKQR